VSLTAADVAEIMRLLEASHFDELELEVDGMKISLRRNAAGGAERAPIRGAPAAGAATPLAAVTPGTAAAPAPAPPAPPAPPADPALCDVSSPLLGTFYRAPKPGAPPFVEVGAAVEADTVIAIVEVMKLMNTVRAGVHGTVAEIFARDGELVEYGQALMRVRRAG
jgi:acetyl-CoA carboxylase biotin carboxyl carrier protein